MYFILGISHFIGKDEGASVILKFFPKTGKLGLWKQKIVNSCIQIDIKSMVARKCLEATKVDYSL